MKDIRQVELERRSPRRLVPGLFALALGLLPAHAAGAASDTNVATGPRPLDASARPAAASLWSDRADLRAAELAASADALWEEDPERALRVQLLRIGRDVPATVTAARRSERLTQRETSRAWLRDRIERDPEARVLWDGEVRARLADANDVTLWCATARTLGRLGETGLAPELALRLDGEDAEIAQAARLALFDLFLRWFDSTESFDRFWPEAQGTCGDSVFMLTARQKEKEARESLVQLLKYEPQRAPELLAGPDPRLRAVAVESLGRAQNREVDVAFATLLAHLETEPNGEACQATVTALLKMQSASESDAPEVQRLRAILIARIRAGAEDLQAPLADALRRLPWGAEPRAEDGLYVGIDALIGQVRRLIAEERLTDRDALVTCLAALQSLARRADEGGHPVADRLAPLAPSLLARMEDPAEAVGVRIATAQFLPLFGGADALTRAAAVLDAKDTPPQLAYSLLGSIGTLAGELPPEDPVARLVLATLLAPLTGDDANLRQRALAQLRSEALAPLVAQANPVSFVAALGRETSADLQTQLLQLIARHGGVGVLRQLVALQRFDAIATAGPATLSQLGDTLAALSGDDAQLLVLAFERLLAVDDEGTRVLRLRDALGEVAALPADSLGALDGAAHHEIVRWAAELRAAAGSLPGGRELLARLVTVHLPACEASVDPAEVAELEHVRALLLADLHALDEKGVEATVVLDAFEKALRLAVERGDARQRGRVLRDRARFHSARGDDAAALDDYRALLALELDAGAPEAKDSVLSLADLRRGGELLFESAGEEGRTPEEARRRVQEALRASLALVNDDVWRLEPDAVRLQDLRDLATRGALAADVERVERAFAAFLGLPELPPAPEEGEESTPVETGPSPDAARWDGLLSERAVHAELLELRRQLRRRMQALSAPPPETPEAPDEPVPDEGAPANPEGGDGNGDGNGDGDGEEDENEAEETPAEGPPGTGGENVPQKPSAGVDSRGR